MKKLFKKLFCKHKWDAFANIEIIAKNAFSVNEIYFFCRDCGKIKKVKK